jgi:hypothetical protein
MPVLGAVVYVKMCMLKYIRFWASRSKELNVTHGKLNGRSAAHWSVQHSAKGSPGQRFNSWTICICSRAVPKGGIYNYIYNAIFVVKHENIGKEDRNAIK